MRGTCTSHFCEYWLSWTNTISEQNISETILILKWGPCLVNRTLQSKVLTKSHFWPDRHIVITMLNFKVVAGAVLWVYNAENVCVWFFLKILRCIHFSLTRGENKRSFLGLPNLLVPKGELMREFSGTTKTRKT